MFNRRKEIRTDDSVKPATSTTDSLRNLMINNWNAGHYIFSNLELEKARPEYILSQMLSTKSTISTGFSIAKTKQHAQDEVSLQAFSSIGAVQCGTIYALKGTTAVIKLPNSPEQSQSLFNDLRNHKIVHDAFQGVSVALRCHVHVPTLKMWVSPKSDHFWSTNAALFRQDVQVPDYGLMSERIYPLQYTVRSALVDTFAPKDIKDRKHDFLGMSKNKDCLIRLYLGRRNNDSPPTQAEKFHLRNFPLHVNEMERLKLDTTYYAKLMAKALAILHWHAGLDANDVEFVFGSSPTFSTQPTAQDIQDTDMGSAAAIFSSDFQHRTVSISLLDFNRCQSFTQDQAGLKKLVDGFYWNDPYYPRPASTTSKDKDLWKVFSKQYLDISAEFVKHGMPKDFIKAVEERGKRRSGNNLFG